MMDICGGDGHPHRMPDNPENPTEQNLRERLKRAEEALHLIRIGSFAWSVATDKITWSEELYRIFEFDPQIHRLHRFDKIICVICGFIKGV